MSSVDVDFFFQKNMMSREDCSIRSSIPWLLMSRLVSVLPGTVEWASCRLLCPKFFFGLSLAGRGKTVESSLWVLVIDVENGSIVDANMLQNGKMQSCGILI